MRNRKKVKLRPNKEIKEKKNKCFGSLQIILAQAQKWSQKTKSVPAREKKQTKTKEEQKNYYFGLNETINK